MTKRQHKGLGILFFIWGIGSLVIALICPFLIKAGVNNHFNKGATVSMIHLGEPMTEQEREDYLHKANILGFTALGIGGFLWVLSAANMISLKIKQAEDLSEDQDENPYERGA
ncbi:unnamed protein product [Moneuplotes crassus]|uniref:Uncharacterized protein n=1 Tax=Euplotes crassus TaxID=5936 RepID=A0AAD2D9S1_EUPCR|nr:unnamed protein product [Moneuplotes crassus]